MINYDKLFNENFSYQLRQRDVDPLKNYFNKKKGWVYIAKTEDNNHLKIGRTGKHPLERAKTLSTVGVFNDYEIIFALPVFNQFLMESKVHKKLKKFNISKEFFSLKSDLAIETLKLEYEKEIQLLNRFLDTDMIIEDLNLLEFSFKIL